MYCSRRKDYYSKFQVLKNKNQKQFFQIIKACISIVKSIINIRVIHFKKKLILVSKNKIEGKSKCHICLTKRSFIHEIKHDLEYE